MIRFIRTLLFFWMPARKKTARRSSTPRAVPARYTRQHIGYALSCLDDAVRAARLGDFPSAYTLLRRATPPLSVNLATYLRLHAASCLVGALDANWGYAGRLTAHTLKRLEAQRACIDERTYWEATAMCREAIRLIPLAKLGMDGHVATTFLQVARQLIHHGQFGKAFAQIERTKELATLSPVLRWHSGLSQEIYQLAQDALYPTTKSRALAREQTREFAKAYHPTVARQLAPV